MRYTPLEKWHKREKKISDRGYVLVMCPEHPKSFAGGWYYEHRLVAERKVGRILKSWETIHHISGHRDDNSDLNLFICVRSEHDHAVD